MISEEFKQKLVDSGLTKAQANSVAASAVFDALCGGDERAVLDEARLQVNQMKKMFDDIVSRHQLLERKINEALDTITALADIDKDFTECLGQEAKEIVGLYAALLRLGKESGDTTSAGYILYAALGGASNEKTIINKLGSRKKFGCIKAADDACEWKPISTYGYED